MYIAFLDESNQGTAEQFTVCGLTYFEVEKCAEIHDFIEKIRAEAGLFPSQPLKWTLPEGWKRKTHLDVHTSAKKGCFRFISERRSSLHGIRSPKSR